MNPRCHHCGETYGDHVHICKLPKQGIGMTDTESLVINDIKERQKLGIKKYGTTLANNQLTLRSWLQHQYEELMDATLYCRRAIQEIDAKEAGE